MGVRWAGWLLRRTALLTLYRGTTTVASVLMDTACHRAPAYSSPMSLVFATQLTAVATAVLAVFAIVTAVFAILAFRKQSQEVRDQASVLALQAAELRESLAERKREAAERRRAQAGRVFVSAEPNPKISDPVNSIALRAENTSQQPIYDLTFMWREGTGEWSGPEYRFPFPVLMPGEQKGFDTVSSQAFHIRIS